MPPKFSVVIPTYNQADSLKVAVKSVLDQTFKDFELTIVNNYSTDHTQDVLDHIHDQRLKIIHFRNHGVIGAGRNAGIKASQGEYVAFLDSDDYWHTNKLQKVAEAIDADPEHGLVCHNQAMVRDGRIVTHTQYGMPPRFKGTMYDYMLHIGNGPSTSATAVARRCLEAVGYFSEDPALITLEDVDLWLRLCKVCSFKFIPDVLGVHNFHFASASANVEQHLSAALAILKKYTSDIENPQRAGPHRPMRSYFAYAFYGAARQYQRMGAFRKTLYYYARTLRCFPVFPKVYAGLALLAADLILGHARRKRLAEAIWGPTWRWG